MPPSRPVACEAPHARTEDLISHILDRYHGAHRRDLAQAIGLAAQIEQTHAQREDCPHGLTDLLVLISDDLEDHQQKEEVVLFPMMLSDNATSLVGPLMRMRLDHDDLAQQMQSLRALTGDFSTPVDADGAWNQLYVVCARLEADLRRHVELENDVLFPRFLGSPAS